MTLRTSRPHLPGDDVNFLGPRGEPVEPGREEVVLPGGEDGDLAVGVVLSLFLLVPVLLLVGQALWKKFCSIPLPFKAIVVSVKKS